MWKFSQMFRRYRTAGAGGAWAGAPHGNVGTEPPLSSIFATRPSGRPAAVSGRLPRAPAQRDDRRDPPARPREDPLPPPPPRAQDDEIDESPAEARIVTDVFANGEPG